MSTAFDSPIPPLADQATLLAARVWLGEDPSSLWDVFTHERRTALAWAWDERPVESDSQALARLRDEHAAQARPDLAQVHSSWWIRALKEEPASVQRAVARGLPPGISSAIIDGLGLDSHDLQPDRPANPIAARAAMALWAERLVGDVSERDDDPPVIVALTRFDAPATLRLIHTAGLAKWSLTDEDPPRLDAKEQERYVLFRAAVGASDSRFYEVAYLDVGSADKDLPHPEGRLGLLTFARLLNTCDPYRVRWALQHLAYPTAKAIRQLIGPSARKAPMLAKWETDILRASWDVLHAEGRIAIPWRKRGR